MLWITVLLVFILLTCMYIASRLTDLIRLLAAWIATDEDKARKVYNSFTE